MQPVGNQLSQVLSCNVTSCGEVALIAHRYRLRLTVMCQQFICIYDRDVITCKNRWMCLRATAVPLSQTGSLPLRGLSHRQWLRVFHIQVNVWWPWLLQIVQRAPKGIASTNTGQGRDEFINTFLMNEWIFHISVVTWLGSGWFTFGLSLKRPFEELWKPHDEDLPTCRRGKWTMSIWASFKN